MTRAGRRLRVVRQRAGQAQSTAESMRARWHSVERAALVCVGLGALACADAPPPEPNDFLFRAPGVAVESTTAQSAGTIAFLGYATAAQGPDAVDRISAVASTPLPHIVMVADVPTCQIRLIDVTGQASSRSLGRCGEGPAEFSTITGLAWRDDAIYAMDADRQQVQVLSPAGVELRRIRFRDALPEMSGRLVWGGLVDSSEFLMVRSYNGLGTDGGVALPRWTRPLLDIAVTPNAAAVRGSDLAIPHLSEMVAQSSGFVHPVRACVRGDQHAKVTNVVATHRLAAEAAILDDDLETVARVIWSAPWTTPTADPAFPGGWRWGIDRAEVACGAQMFALGLRDFEGNDERTGDSHGRIEVRRYNGRVIATRQWDSTSAPAERIGSPRLISGDTLYTLVTDTDGWQRLAMWRVTP